MCLARKASADCPDFPATLGHPAKMDSPARLDCPGCLDCSERKAYSASLENAAEMANWDCRDRQECPERMCPVCQEHPDSRDHREMPDCLDCLGHQVGGKFAKIILKFYRRTRRYASV